MAEIEGQESNALVPLMLDDTISEFVKDILEGLKSIPKYLPFKYLYSLPADSPFQELHKREEYYINKCEIEIIENESKRILETFSKKGRFKLIDIGISENDKTRLLLDYFWKNSATFDYIPIADSNHDLEYIAVDIWNSYPTMNIFPLAGDYSEILHDLKADKTRKVVIFLSKKIENYRFNEAIEILQDLSSTLNIGDLVLIGFDLKKDPRIIQNAMNDKHDVAKAIYLNFLEQISNTLSGNIDPNNFIHQSCYDPETGEYKNYLVSTMDQTVRFSLINEDIPFKAWETILIDTYKKYEEEEIYFLELCTGFTPSLYLYDEKHYFLLSIWQKNA